MTTVSQNEAVEQFSQLMAPYISSPDVNVHQLLAGFTSFYEQVRVAGALLDSDHDMLLLEWGATVPHLIDSFQDFRNLADDELKFAGHEHRWLGLTRQIYIGEDEQVEFDDAAIGLCAFLFFGAAAGGEPSSSIWVQTPAVLREKLDEFLNVPYVRGLVESRPMRVNVFISAIG